MRRFDLTALVAASLLILPLAQAAQEPSTKYSYAENACTTSERWIFSATLTEDWKTEFLGFKSRKFPAVRGFSEALTLRMLARTDEIKSFAEYWISRALFESKLPHIAYQGFNAIASRPLAADTAGIQLAALECLNQIRAHYPTLHVSAEVTQRLPEYLKHSAGKKSRESVWDSSISYGMEQLSSEKSAGIEATLALVKDSRAHDSFLSGLWEAKRGRHSQVIQHLKAFLGEINPPASLKRHTDLAHLILSRSYYSTGQFEPSVNELKLIKKNSNDLASALTELSWAFLLDERYSEAIGTAMNLQKGGLRHTFSPEAPMVMAMAMNELCQFPESVKAINVFKKHYEKPYKWLDRWNRSPAESGSLYKLSVDFLRLQGNKAKNTFPVPDSVATEWVRSPIFISHQDEINLLFDERTASSRVARAGAVEQTRLGLEILKSAQELKTKIRLERSRSGEDTELSSTLRDELSKLKRNLVHYKRLGRAAPTWRTLLARHEQKIPGLEKKLITRINSDLRERNTRMLRQLEEVAENNQLIEVEIYNGASQDIIWQNAHPDYKEVAARLKQESASASAAKVWDWGRSPASSDDEDGEIWEDELGSFKADLLNNCESKDKYLALRRLK